MSRIKSTGNKSTEMRFRSALSMAGIRGWTIQPEIPGHPDLAFLAERVAVFLDGCFWHGCADHFSPPKTRRASWIKKIKANQTRDARTVAALLCDGWKVFRVWEHDLADPATIRGIALRVARAADTPDTVERYTRERKNPTPGLDVMACVPCGRMTGHYTKDLTGRNVYKEARCEECDTTTRRINGVALRGGTDNGDNV
jgi:DNA mismatch endonuclease (patch repair protein)